MTYSQVIIGKSQIILQYIYIYINVLINDSIRFLKISLFSFHRDRLIRPVGNSSDRLTVKMGLKLSQIIGVDMKRQIMITNVWVEQVRQKD